MSLDAQAEIGAHGTVTRTSIQINDFPPTAKRVLKTLMAGRIGALEHTGRRTGFYG